MYTRQPGMQASGHAGVHGNSQSHVNQHVGLLYFSLPGFSGQGNLIKPLLLLCPGHLMPPHTHTHTNRAGEAHVWLMAEQGVTNRGWVMPRGCPLLITRLAAADCIPTVGWADFNIHSVSRHSQSAFLHHQCVTSMHPTRLSDPQGPCIPPPSAPTLEHVPPGVLLPVLVPMAGWPWCGLQV